MSSLLKKMFDTMPLKSAVGLARANSFVDSDDAVTMGTLKQYLKAHRTPPQLDPDPPAPAANTSVWDAVIWGWHTADGDPGQVTQVTCRVRDASFMKFVVLDTLEWGSAPITITDETKTEGTAESFGRNVVVVAKYKDKDVPVKLPLTATYHVVSFSTPKGGKLDDGNDPFFPFTNGAYQDASIVHFFLYDVDPANERVFAPDPAEMKAVLDRCDDLNGAQPDDVRKAFAELFKDDVWYDPTYPDSPTCKVSEVAPLCLNGIRILVACSMTLGRERDDFVPGRFANIARLFPHVMVIASEALVRVEAGVHFKRPESNPHTEHSSNEHDGMVPKLGSLLIADSNAGGMVIGDFDGKPFPAWASLFSYYVDNPLQDPKVGSRLIPVVIRANGPDPRGKTEPRIDSPSTVKRDCSDIGARPMLGPIPLPAILNPINLILDHYDQNKDHLRKRVRQGEFDNIHIAPRMVVKEEISEVMALDDSGQMRKFPFNPQHDYHDWKMDSVVMAPFCAHDCFHMHWRWSDNANVVPTTYGWGPKNPYKVKGAVMVPENQDVFIKLLGDTEFLYLARAHDVGTNSWQVFCHHGAGYAVHAGGVLKEARSNTPYAVATKFLSAGLISTLLGADSWALLYWHLRYRLKAVERNGNWWGELVERFEFVDEKGALER